MKGKSQSRLGVFEESADLATKAQHNAAGFLDAGRGNPNWINTKARLAFARMIEFGVLESQRTLNQNEMAGWIEADHIEARFNHFLDLSKESDVFLAQSLNYAKSTFNLNGDAILEEWTNAVIGNHYPAPSRALPTVEAILNAFLQSILYPKCDLAPQTDLFLTEGGTAAICYLFNSLQENKLIQKGDKLAISTPIFPPYLEIPKLNHYDLIDIDLNASSEEAAQNTLTQLSDPKLKALFIVNPSNPGSKALSANMNAVIVKAVQNNPKLMIITDDVYGSFVSDFESLYGILPQNTALVYSFSKLYGATGWRLGAIAIHQDSVFDRLIQYQDEKEKHSLNLRYSHVCAQPETMKFIDRLAADSRSIGLYHTSGLSTPQQMMATFFALTHLTARSNEDAYIRDSNALIATRYHYLYQGLKLPEDQSPLNAKYYALIDFYQLAKHHYGRDFAHFLQNKVTNNEFLVQLAEKEGIVLVDGLGFGAKEGDLRVSASNLSTESYQKIGEQMLRLLANYHSLWIKNNSNSH